MYIFELINKFRKKNRAKNKELPPDAAEAFIENFEDEIEDALTCEHVFLPIDSTKTVLACTKCGYVIKNQKMKFDETDKNPFKPF